MNVREKLRQRAVAPESKDHTRRTQNVARHKSKRGDTGSGQKNRTTQIAEKFRCRFGEWRVRMIREIGAESTLRYQLDKEVNDRRDDERQIRGPWNGARGILHFAAWNQCHLDSDEGEN